MAAAGASSQSTTAATAMTVDTVKSTIAMIMVASGSNLIHSALERHQGWSGHLASSRMHEFRRLFLRVWCIRSRRPRAPELLTDIHVGERRRAALAVCEA